MPDRYDSTRRAWEDIWDEATIEVELEAAALRAPRNHQRLPAVPHKRDVHWNGHGLSASYYACEAGYDVHVWITPSTPCGVAQPR